MDQNNLSIDDLRQLELVTNSSILRIIAESNVDCETKDLIDSVAQQSSYMFSYLIDYINQHQ